MQAVLIRCLSVAMMALCAITVEEFQGGLLLRRAGVRWMSKNEFEETITFFPDPDSIGDRTRFLRDWSGLRP